MCDKRAERDGIEGTRKSSVTDSHDDDLSKEDEKKKKKWTVTAHFIVLLLLFRWLLGPPRDPTRCFTHAQSHTHERNQKKNNNTTDRKYI